MPESEFAPGFRFSKTDLFVLLTGTASSVVVGSMHLWIGAVIAFVVCHFFPFCNIFRISRPLELTWAALFVGLGGSTIVFSLPGWPATFLLSLVVTVGIVLIEMRKASYHGIVWQRINPQLREWWKTNAKAER